MSFRESAGPTAVYGFTEEGKAQGLEMEEICMNMEAEIEEIVYTDETVCNHVEYDSCHDSFKSVLRKSMVRLQSISILFWELECDMCIFYFLG